MGKFGKILSGFIGVILIVLIVCLCKIVNAEISNWFDKSWSKRNKIKITNSNDIQLTDYQLKIKIPYFDGMKRKFQDVRFADKNGNQISYFIEDVAPEEEVILWIKLPDIPAGSPSLPSTTEIYIYYDNKKAESDSSFDSVFQKLEPIPGTVGLWHLDEGSGNEITDSSDKAHNGTVDYRDEPTTSVEWINIDGGKCGEKEISFKKGACLKFNGDGKKGIPHIWVGHSEDLNVTSFTAECWVKILMIEEGYYDLLRKGSGLPFLGVSPQRNAYSCCASLPTSLGSGPSTLNLNEWHHLAVTFDENTKEYKIYVDGVCKNQTKAPGIPEPNKEGLVIVGYYSATLNGLIDEIRLVNRALSEGEIKADFERRKFAPVEPDAIVLPEIETFTKK